MSDADKTAPYWSREAGDLSTSLGSGPNGLTAARAAEQLAVVGPNSVEDAQRLGPLRLLWRQVGSPLVLILIFAAAVSLSLSQWVDAGIILAIVIGSSLLGFYQEYRASTAVEELKKRLALTCRVVRDGVEGTVHADVLVPGDVLVLSAGNLIPADGRILEASDFLVSEASMTGESFPVEKQPGVVPADAPIGRRTNVVFLGASVRSGTARVVVVETGPRTVFGAIAARLRARAPETNFAHGLRHFGYLLIRAMVAIVLFVLTVNLLLHRPVIESLLFSVALAVGLSPELLPAIVSVTLSAGARAMCKEGVIVRRLDAIENLGSMTVLCTDKTGTLTEGTIVLADATDPNGRTSAAVRQLAFLNAAFETGIDNPIDAAIVAAGEQAGLSTTSHAKIDEIPYDFLRKRLTIVMTERGDAERHLVVTKGAFVNVLSICTQVERDGAVCALTQAIISQLSDYYEAKGKAGLRVLALASRAVSAKGAYQREDEREMVFAGFLLFLDPPKADAARVLGDLANLHVEVKVITGDNRFVTGHLAATVGLDPTSMLTGEALAQLDDEALWNAAPRTSLFAEIDPQQKERIVRALQRTGHSVGYLGDGINDAPALHAADVGISVDQAVDVARESADIILLKRNLDVLRRGVVDGRRTFANTLKYISITTSANFGNMVSMALAAPLLPFLPLVAKQILLNNFLSDVPSMAISTDLVDAGRVTHPQRWDIKQIRRYMIVFGLLSSAFDLLTFAALLLLFHAGEATFQTTWFVVSLLTELGVVLVLRTRGPAWRSRPSDLLLWTTVAATAFALATPFFGRVSMLFGFVPLSTVEMATVAGIVIAYLAATEVAKRWFFRAQGPTPPDDSAPVRRPRQPCLLVLHRLFAACAVSHINRSAHAVPSGQSSVLVLHEFIAVNRDEIIRRCRAKVATRSIPPPIEAEIDYGVPVFLDQLRDALRLGQITSPAISTSAIKHGHDLLRRGFTVSQVVHDYGDVCQAITELAVELNAPISTDDFRTLNRCLDDAIAGAVTEYGRERNQSGIDGESARGSERLGFFAHELRNLMNTSLMAFEVLKTGNVGVAGSTGTVLHRSLLASHALISRSLAEVRLTQGVQNLEQFAVAAFIDEIASASTLEANARGVRLTVAPVEDGVEIRADRQVLAAVVGNLLQNAFKFTRPRTTVTLRVGASAERVLIEVQDECGGLPSGDVSELFRPFEQRSADRTGIGLGLAFSRWGAEANDGRIYARNLPGRGCVFIVDLPRQPVAVVAVV